jgi:protein-L-isoaspartate(D-aspartate) O-methyltransferase
MDEQTDFSQKRKQLVELMQPFLNSHPVKEAFLAVKRELFVPEALRESAYIDDALPIGNNQTISQPSTIAVMLEMLELKKGQKLLEVGSGSGYVLALLSKAVGPEGKVFGIEKIKELAEGSKKRLEEQGFKNVSVVEDDGSQGLPSEAPFDRILISAACPFVPKQLFDQLVESGIIVAPVGDRFTQQMQQMKKVKGKPLKKEYVETFFAFVPLKGKFGFS